jgi:hypothetical protein
MKTTHKSMHNAKDRDTLWTEFYIIIDDIFTRGQFK